MVAHETDSIFTQYHRDSNHMTCDTIKNLSEYQRAPNQAGEESPLKNICSYSTEDLASRTK